MREQGTSNEPRGLSPRFDRQQKSGVFLCKGHAALLFGVPFVHDLTKRRDVGRRRAAAAAHHCHAGFQQFRQLGGHVLRAVRVDPLAIHLRRGAGVGPGEERQIGDGAIAADDFDAVVHDDVAAAVDAEGGHSQCGGLTSNGLGRQAGIGL